MCNCNNTLSNLVQKTQPYPLDSKEYRINLTLIISEMQKSGRILRRNANNSNVYEDALQNAWISFAKNLPKYDSTQGCIFAWFNTILNRRITDEFGEIAEEIEHIQFPFLDKTTGEYINPLDLIPAPPKPSDLSNLREQIHQWLQDDERKLRRLHTRDRWQGNCYHLILKRVIDEKSWREISREIGIPHNTLDVHFKTHCLPCLREWLILEGYEEIF